MINRSNQFSLRHIIMELRSQSVQFRSQPQKGWDQLWFLRSLGYMGFDSISGLSILGECNIQFFLLMPDKSCPSTDQVYTSTETWPKPWKQCYNYNRLLVPIDTPNSICEVACVFETPNVLMSFNRRRKKNILAHSDKVIFPKSIHRLCGCNASRWPETQEMHIWSGQVVIRTDVMNVSTV